MNRDCAPAFFDLSSVCWSCRSLTIWYSVRYYQINTHLGMVHGSVHMSLPRHSVQPHGPLNRGCLTRYSQYSATKNHKQPPLLYAVPSGKEGLLATSYRVQYLEGWFRCTKGCTPRLSVLLLQGSVRYFGIREASNRLNYYSVGLASCRFLVDAVEVRDTYTNEMRSHSHYPFSPLEQCSYS